MEIQNNIQPPAIAPALQKYNQDLPEMKRGDAVAASAVVDIQSPQEPLAVALNSTLRSLVENAGLSPDAASAGANPAAYSPGPEGVAARISSVAAHLVAASQGSSEERTDNLPQLIDAINQSINQGFDEAERIAADPANAPLLQAKSLTQEQINSLESILGLRDSKTA